MPRVFYLDLDLFISVKLFEIYLEMTQSLYKHRKIICIHMFISVIFNVRSTNMNG
jgi:hypothetical protein